MDEEKWLAWEMQTSKRWSDMEDVMKYMNIDFIDYDHKMLAEFAFKLNQVLDKSESEFSLSLIEESNVLLNNLHIYAQEHFSREENFTDLYQLPNAEMHKKEHRKILTMLSEALDNFYSGKSKLTRKLKSEVMDWLIEHINVFDYNFFNIANWSRNLTNSSNWDEVKAIIHLTGINEIDNQHQTLTEIALEAMKNISINPTDRIVEEACKNIMDYASFHFDYEAQFMKAYNIKESEKHLMEHSLFIDKIKQFSLEMKLGSKQVDDMKTWILTWWISHINSVDKDYFKYSNWAYQLIEKAEKLEDVVVVLRKTGIEEIDNEHMMLMDLTLNLNKLIKIEDDKNNHSIKDEVVSILDKTYAVAAAHFEREEKMMQEEKMDDLRNHRAEHSEILNKLKNMKENYVSGRLYLSSNIKTMILEWWIQHTNTTDFRTFAQNYKYKKSVSKGVNH